MLTAPYLRHCASCLHFNKLRRTDATNSPDCLPIGLQYTHPSNGPLPATTRYQKGKTNLDFSEARDSEWQWHQLGRMQVCTSLQTDNHAGTPPLRFLQAGRPSCHPTDSVEALKAYSTSELIMPHRRGH